MLRGCLLSMALVTALTGCDCGGNGDPGPVDASFPDGAFVPDGGPAPDGARPDGGAGSADECGNGLDDDLDGMIDEECFCVPGDMQSCFSGLAGQRGVGACGDGIQNCEADFEFGIWGACTGETAPVDEVCETVGVDENCDGAVNEDCPCDPSDPPVACGSDVGACRPGTQSCVDGMLGDCEGSTGPVGEVCNDIDDDCDGMVDETLTRRCGMGRGECRRGTETCVAGTWETCAGSIDPITEACDGLDNDCDGTVDEALTRSCGTGVGACSMGMQSCTGGAWSMCTGGTLPMVETCDGTDEDCDGTTDESLTRACGTSTGTCRSGSQTCTGGAFGTCTGGVGPGTEVCDGRLDEDCDGAVDEGCTCTTGSMRPCGTDTGACMRGNQTCSSGMWGMCMGDVGPVPETCDMTDEDCDGMVDEGGVCPTSPPIVTCPADITAEVLRTVTLAGSGSDPDGGTVTFMWTVMSRPMGSSANPSSPTNPTTSFFLDASGTFVLQLCATDDEGETTCCTVTLTSTPPGVLHVEMSWNTAYGDADLHLLNVTRTPPAGWWTSDDCHWRNRTPDWGPPGAAANPTQDRDDTDGFGPENITINTSPAAGTYHIGAHYYCEHSIGMGAAPGMGSTEATVRVFCMGSLIATYNRIRLGGTDDWVTVASVDWPSCVGRSVNTRTTGRALLPSSLTPPANIGTLHCEIRCTRDSDCLSGERCTTVVGPGGRRMICVQS